MPDVGVLELQIRDNAGDAGQGLNNLADALSRVRTAVGGDKIGLSKVGTELNNLARQISSTKSNTPTAIKNITALFKSIEGFSKIKSINLNTESLQNLKDIVGSGFNIGTTGTQMNALKNALGGEWNATKAAAGIRTVKDVAEELSSNGTASKLNEVTKAIKAFSAAYKDIPTKTNKFQNIIAQLQSGEIANQRAMYEEATRAAKEKWEAGGRHGIAVNLGQFGGKRKQVPGQMEMDLTSTASTMQEGFAAVKSKIVEATEPVKELNIQLQETKDRITSIVVPDEKSTGDMFKYIADPITALMDRFKDPSAVRGDVFDAILPKINDISIQAKIATKDIDDLMHALDNPAKDKMKFVDKVNIATGVTRGEQITSSAEESAGVFLQYIENIEAVERALDKANNSAQMFYETMGHINEIVQEASFNANQTAEAFGRMFQMWNAVRMSQSLEAGSAIIPVTDNGSWKNGAIPVEGTVSSDNPVKNLLGESAGSEGMLVFSSLEEAARHLGITLEEARARAEATWEAIEHGSNETIVFKSLEEAAEHYGVTVDELKAKFAGGMFVPIDSLGKSVAAPVEEVKNAAADVKEAFDDFIPTDKFIETYSHLDYLKNKLKEMEETLDSKRRMGIVDKDEIDKAVMSIMKMREEIRKLEEAEGSAEQATSSFKYGWKDFTNGLKRAFPLLTRLKDQLGRIMIRRSLMAVLRSIVKGVREGLQNVYEYSKAVGSDFAPAMDSAASSLLTMKNSIGAALAPFVQALIPALQTVVNWFITVLNYANQFFALLTGQNSWLHAIDATTEAYNNQSKAAGKAAKEAKDLLADWDELNIIQSEAGNGGGGGGNDNTTPVTEMFEQLTEFDQGIKNIINWIQDHMEIVKAIAESIGAAILAWKFSKLFSGDLAFLKTLVAGLATVAIGLQLTWAGAYEAGLNGGFDTTTGLTTAGGMLVSAIGGALIGFKVGGPWGALIGGATGLIASIAVAVSAYMDGDRTRKLRSKWGKLHLTEDQIKELVDEQVTAPVMLSLEIMNTSIQKRKEARDNANAKIASFSSSLDAAKFVMETDSSEQGIKDALASAQEAIKAIQTQLDADREGLKLSFTKFTYKDAEGKDVTTELYSSLLQGNWALDKYFTEMGKDIAKFIEKGFDEGLSEEEQLMALDLMETLNNITSTAKQNYESKRIVRESEREMAKLQDMYDYETVNAVVDAQRNRMDEYKKTVQSQMEEDLESYYQSLEYFIAIRDDYAKKGNGKKVSEYDKYISDTNLAISNTEGWLKQIENGTYNWHTDSAYDGMYQRMRKMWVDKFYEWYKDDFIESLLNDDVESPFDNNPAANRILETFGIGLQEILSDDEIDNYLQSLLEKYNGDQERALEEAQRKLGPISNAMLDTYFQDFSSKEYDEDKIAQNIKETIFSALLSGAAEGSTLWDEIIQGAKNSYGSEIVDQIYGESYEGLKALYDGMIEDMFSNMTKEEFLNKYSDNPEFAKIFTNYFKEDFAGASQRKIDILLADFNEWSEQDDERISELQRKTEELKTKIYGVAESAIEDATNAVDEHFTVEDVDFDKLFPNVEEDVNIWDLNDFAKPGTSGGGGAPMMYTPNMNGQAQEVEVKDMATDVQTGVSGVQTGVNTMRTDMNSLMNQLITICRQIANRPINVQVSPTAQWGDFNKQSGRAFGRVTGNVEMES